MTKNKFPNISNQEFLTELEKRKNKLKKIPSKQVITTMPKSKKLQKKIENKLDQLSKLLNKFAEAQAINSDDPETWDSDTLYGLVENLKEALELLEDKESKQLDDFGQPIVLEEGLCTLVDEYHSEEEGTDNF